MTHTASIWRWEQYFQVVAQLHAEYLFERLDGDLTPTFRILGVLEQPSDHEPIIAVVPRDSELVPALFDGLGDRAKSLHANDPEQQLFQSHPHAQDNHERMLLLRALQGAVGELLASHLDGCDSRVSFCGLPVEVSDWDRTHLVVPILRLNGAAVARHSSLQRNRYEIHELRHARIATSLLDAAVLTFLRGISQGLNTNPELACMDPTGASTDELLRRAGRRLMQTPEVRTEELAIETTWNACDALAGTKYEGAETRGRLIIAPKDSPDVDVRLAFGEGVPMKRHRALRKLLEMTTAGGDGLLTNGMEVHGVGRIGVTYRTDAETVFSVEFLGDGIWELRHQGLALMRVRYGIPELPRAKITEEQLGSALSARFPCEAGGLDKSAIWHVANAIIASNHGSILVVSSEAGSEACRLAGQGFAVRPERLDNELLARAAAMDGAVLCDLTGACHAVGIILDGAATERGDSARGSRYNSAVRYVDSRDGMCVALVISHDGMVDLVVPSSRLRA